MKTIITTAILIFALIKITYCCENCPGNQGNYDWCTVEVRQEDPDNRVLILGVHSYWNSCRGLNVTPEPKILWCQALIDPQGHDGDGLHHPALCPPYWNFGYHVVATHSENNNKVSYDAVYNIKGDLDIEYGNWLKYYYNSQGLHTEPPAEAPSTYDDPENVNILGVFQGLIWTVHYNDLHHPYYNYVTQKDYSDIFIPLEIDSSHNYICNPGGWGKYYQIVFNAFVDHKRGDLYGWSMEYWGKEKGRKYDIKNPGDYLNEPFLTTFPPGYYLFSEPESAKIAAYLKEIFKAEMNIDNVLPYIYGYHKVLDDSTRTEFHGRFMLDGKKATFGGWFDKVAVGGVVCNYDNIDEFMKLAHKYFKLPEISLNKIEVAAEDNNIFYSYLDRESRFMLRGFSVGLSNPNNNDKDYSNTKVIELTKYYDKEFIP
jgi:hypothetical protein